MEILIGQVILFAGPYTPKGFAPCDGSLLNIMDEPGLFAVIGTTYGGDGTTTFAVPDLRGRQMAAAAPSGPVDPAWGDTEPDRTLRYCIAVHGEAPSRNT